MPNVETKVRCCECRGTGSIELLVKRVICTACNGSGSIAEAVLDAKIDSLDLSPPARAALKKASTVTVRQLIGCSENSIRALSGITDPTIVEIKRVLARLGLRLRPEGP